VRREGIHKVKLVVSLHPEPPIYVAFHGIQNEKKGRGEVHSVERVSVISTPYRFYCTVL